MNSIYLENNSIVLNGNVLIFKKSNSHATLSKNQTKLIYCLLNEVNEKISIINHIWNSKKNKSNQNNYNQLVYKTKALLITNGFPADFIMTIPGYGVCINKNYSEPLIPERRYFMKTLSGMGVYQEFC